MKYKRQNKVFIAIILLAGYLGVYKNSLAIFHNDGSPPDIMSRSVTLYPEADQRALKSGIPFSNSAELSSLMEDFLS